MTKVARVFVSGISAIQSLLADILFPFFCVGCGKEGKILCDLCKEKIEWYFPRGCVFCGVVIEVLSSGNICQECAFAQSIEAVIVATYYHQRIVRELIQQLKYEYVEHAAVVLAEILFAYGNENRLWKQYSGFTLVPVSLHIRRFFERGFNQSERIAFALSSLLKLPSTSTYLKRTRYTKPQVKLSDVERQENVVSSFEASIEAEKKDILLVDDVFTTGATLRECARALKAKGANRVVALVIARG